MVKPSPSLSIIIVSWNVRELLDQALTSVYAAIGDTVGLEVVVVDNASDDGSAQMVETKFPQARIIANPRNLGFTGGNNQGIAHATGDYLFLLNSDTEVRAGALQHMVAYLETHRDVGLLGPRLLNPDGSTQSSRRRFPSLAILFLESTWLQALTPLRLLDRYYVADRTDGEVQDVDWVTGAAMMVRRETVEQVGGFDEGFFMYSEELDWCRRIRLAGWRIAFTPGAEIVHFGGKSSEQVAPARHVYFQASKVRYARKYHGKIVSELLRVWLISQYLWQIVVEALKWSVGHRRNLRAARLGAYWHVVRSGLRQPQVERRD